MDKPNVLHDQVFSPIDMLVFLTNRVGRLLANDVRKRALEEGMELIPTQMGILVDLWVKDGVKQQDLAVSLIKDKGTVARTLDYFEKENIVVRIPDQEDKRYKRIYLTHKGKAMRDKVHPLAIETEHNALEEISVEDLKTCKEVLRKVYENLMK